MLKGSAVLSSRAERRCGGMLKGSAVLSSRAEGRCGGMLKGSAVYQVGLRDVVVVRGHVSNCPRDKFCQKKLCLVSVSSPCQILTLRCRVVAL